MAATFNNDSNDLVMNDFMCNDLLLIMYVILYIMICFYYYSVEPPGQNGQIGSIRIEP